MTTKNRRHHQFYRLPVALAVLVVLSACSSRSDPLELLPTVDRMVLSSGTAQTGPKTGSISIEEMLANARKQPGDEDNSPIAKPSTTLTVNEGKIDSAVLQAVGSFLTAADDFPEKSLIVYRPDSEEMLPVDSTRDAVKLGKLLMIAGFSVRISVSDDLESGSYRIGFAEASSS